MQRSGRDDSRNIRAFIPSREMNAASDRAPKRGFALSWIGMRERFLWGA